ncbi:MAG: hypothetical protein NWE89_04735 [Candidatus Bathyarchaeota archaeon]|nr:hypothetical protein [Candidatus Bathyarchaeota archaeon]
MGAICPEGCGYQPIQQNITATGVPAHKAKDVIAQRLRCGHVVGGEEYDEFLKEVHRIDYNVHKKTAEIERTAKNQKAVLAKKIFHKEEE